MMRNQTNGTLNLKKGVKGDVMYGEAKINGRKIFAEQ